MIRIATAVLLSLAMIATAVASAYALPPPGAISWVVDHHAKTITVTVELEIYSACSGNPAGTDVQQAVACRDVTSQVTQFLADKIKAQIESVWNAGYEYKCYRLIVNVDVTLGADKEAVDPGKIGVRVDPSPGGVRSYVDGSSAVDSWNSDDPSARVDPTNDGEWETTWSESLGKGSSTYAHEFGHVIGLDDAYQDFTDPATGRVGSAPRPGAPIDLMSTGAPNISQETINRVVRRSEPLMIDTDGNSVSDSDFKCDLQLYITGAELQQTSPGRVLSYDLSIDPGGPIDLPVDKNDAFSATTSVHVSGPVKALICSGHYDSQEELKVTGTVSTNSNGDRVAHVKLSGPPGSGTSQVKCDNAGGSFPISGGGGFSNRWTIGIGPLDLVVGDPPVPVTSDKPVSNITTHVAGEFQVLDQLPPE